MRLIRCSATEGLLLCLIAAAASLIGTTEAFAPAAKIGTRPSHRFMADASADDDDDEPRRNPDRPELPELKNDFDWDAKFGGDSDWITTDIPGKLVVDDLSLAAQVSGLDKLEEKWRKEREIEEYEGSLKTGWVPEAELANGRFAMFFLVTGLLTELWTGVTLPGQVEEVLRIAGIIGFD